MEDFSEQDNIVDMPSHIPVLLHEVCEGLQCHQKGAFLDCTVGCGGHTAVILAQHPENRVIGIDRDENALQVARQQLTAFGDRVMLFHERFEHFDQVLCQAGMSIGCKILPCLDGILMDLGVSSLQLEDAARGFSFRQTGWLDMRMDTQPPAEIPSKTAYDVVNTYSIEQLANIIFRYGEERQARRIAKRLVETRASHPIETTTQLAKVVEQAIPRKFHPKGIHPATKVFQAIRIEVNEELQRLGDTLERAVQYLNTGGRICVISFHSLEDRIVKRTFARLAKGCQCPPDFPVCVCGLQPSLTVVSRRPIVASEKERARNPRSRSAKLRIAQKCGQ